MSTANRLRRVLALTLVCGLLFGAGEAGAHAIVVESSPRANATVNGPDVSFRLRFNSRIDHRRSRLTVIGADQRALPVPIDDSAEPAIVTGVATGLANGSYRLRWQVLAVDGHITRGDIPFRVGSP